MAVWNNYRSGLDSAAFALAFSVIPDGNLLLRPLCNTAPLRSAAPQLWRVQSVPLHFDISADTLLCRSGRAEKTMTEERLELPQGTLDLLILKALALESLHGWAVSERLQQMSGEAIQVQQGSLYPALHRLERRGWVKAKWAISENNRRAKYYELTSVGRKQLAAEVVTWRKLTNAVDQILGMA
jgi:PadR family transcriptional regulator PadR